MVDQVMGASADADRAATAAQPSPAVSGIAGIPSAWEAGAFVVRTVGGERRVAGWVSDDFALDFRVFKIHDETYSAWSLTHLATGYSVCHIIGSFIETVALVAELRATADWSFTDHNAAKDVAEAFTAFRERHSDCVNRGVAAFSATSISPYASAMSASGQDPQGLEVKPASAVPSEETADAQGPAA